MKKLAMNKYALLWITAALLALACFGCVGGESPTEPVCVVRPWVAYHDLAEVELGDTTKVSLCVNAEEKHD